MDHQNPEYSLIKVFLASFLIASIAGLARLLRVTSSGKKISNRLYFSAMLNSGILGLVVALLWYHSFSNNLTFLIGISALAGVGGVSLIDFIILFVKKKIGIKIEVTERRDDNDSGPFS